MGIKYQVFVSSTYEDLKSERNQVIRAILEMGHIPVGMEMFSAADEEQWQIISRHIEESDYYAVVVAHRYGSRVGDTSYTRKEYEHAVSCGVPVLGFIIEDPAPWPSDRVDRSPDEVAMLDNFKNFVRQKPISFWNSAEDLYGKFSVALMKAIAANFREGWVRASAAAGPEVTAEITRLSAENAKLRTALAQAKRESETNREAELSKLDSQMKRHSSVLRYRYHTGDRSWVSSDEITYTELFDILAPALLAEASLGTVSTYLFVFAREDSSRDGLVAQNWVRDILSDFAALDLVMPSERKRSLKDTEEYWNLTSLGRDLHKWQRRRSLMSAERTSLTNEAREATGDEELPPEGSGKTTPPAQRTRQAKKPTPATKQTTPAKKAPAKKATAAGRPTVEDS
ncbi:DUF4062 domain-containing protein [Micromonospora chokoriensis]